MKLVSVILTAQLVAPCGAGAQSAADTDVGGQGASPFEVPGGSATL